MVACFSNSALNAVIATIISLSALTPSVAYAGRYDGLVKGLEEFLGGVPAIKRSDATAFVAQGQNGNKFRMDFSGHGDRPHFHLETPRGGDSKLGDAPGVSHRNYFKDK